jgi:hypothetical protein
MQAGTAAHAALHREALRKFSAFAGDARCFVATALWGPIDPRTQALREWRDRWLLRHRWGPAAARLYYRVSPRLVSLVVRAPWLRAAIDRALSFVAHRVVTWHE